MPHRARGTDDGALAQRRTRARPRGASCATRRRDSLDGEHAPAHVGVVCDNGALARRRTRARPRECRARRRCRDSLDGEHAPAHVGAVRDDGAATRSMANTLCRARRPPPRSLDGEHAPRGRRARRRCDSLDGEYARARARSCARRRRDSLDGEQAPAHVGVVHDDARARTGVVRDDGYDALDDGETRTPTWGSCATTAPQPARRRRPRAPARVVSDKWRRDSLDGEHAHVRADVVRDDGAATRSTANTFTPTRASCATTASRLARRRTRARPRGRRARYAPRLVDGEHAHARAGVVQSSTETRRRGLGPRHRDEGTSTRSTANTRAPTWASCATTAPLLARQRTRARPRGHRATTAPRLARRRTRAHVGVVRDDGAATRSTANTRPRGRRA